VGKHAFKNLSVEMRNFDTVIQELKERGDNVRAILKDAANLGAEIIIDVAEVYAPVPGAVAKETVMSHKDVAIVDIGVSKKKWWAKFFEVGATPHEIKGTKMPLVFEGDDGRIVTWMVEHPGMPAQPFLRPAFDGQKDNATKTVGAVIKGQVNGH